MEDIQIPDIRITEIMNEALEKGVWESRSRSVECSGDGRWYIFDIDGMHYTHDPKAARG